MTPALRRRARMHAGFTLLEVMVALALLSLSMMAIADLTGAALRNHAYARELSTATLLARGKMAELEERYEDQGFKDFDETLDGNFEEEGHREVRWRADLVRPDVNLSSDQLLAAFAGLSSGEDSDGKGILDALLGKMTGGTSGGTAQGSADASSGGPTTGASPAGAAMTGAIQAQMNAFGETLKKSLRELRLTVSWGNGRSQREFTVSTELVVLNPKAPGGARGDSPDVPPGAATGAAQEQMQQNILQQLGKPGG